MRVCAWHGLPRPMFFLTRSSIASAAPAAAVAITHETEEAEKQLDIEDAEIIHSPPVDDVDLILAREQAGILMKVNWKLLMGKKTFHIKRPFQMLLNVCPTFVVRHSSPFDCFWRTASERI